jgi:hypothetical protein
MLLDEFVSLFQTRLIPNYLNDLRQCKNIEDVLLWKRKLLKDLKDQKVQGEGFLDDYNIDPQEESKEEILMPRIIFAEAQAL